MNTSLVTSVFTQQLVHFMKQSGFRQVDLIERARQRGVKLGKSQLSQYISGKSLPRYDMVQTLAQLLNCTADDLLNAPSPKASNMQDSLHKAQSSSHVEHSHVVATSTHTPKPKKPCRSFKTVSYTHLTLPTICSV